MTFFFLSKKILIFFIRTFLVLATILALTLRSGDKTCLQLVLFSLSFFHALSFISKTFAFSYLMFIDYREILVAFWLLKTSDTRIKSIIAIIFHLTCLGINLHFSQSIKRTIPSSSRTNKLKSFFNSLLAFPSAASSSTIIESTHTEHQS